MLRKSVIAALGFLGLFLVGTAVGTAPASAGYACGPWNNFCRPACGPWNGWCGTYFVYPGWGSDWYGNNGGRHNWGNSHGHSNWNGNWNNGHNDNHDQAYKHKDGKHYD